MKKSFILLIAFFTFSLFAQAQNFNISSLGLTDTSNLCSGTLHDPGGPAGQYGNSQFGYFVIDPIGTEQVEVIFTTMNLNSGDYVYFYDGVGTSGTFLGGYTGNNLPNGGAAITSFSDAITVYFTSNFSFFANGFSANWSTTSSTMPNASFAVSNNSPAFRQAVSFTNNSTGGAISKWHFGDGTTSNDINPVHQYSNSGSFSAYLVSTNCVGSDTSLSQTINVSAAPSYSVSPDSIYSSVTCGNTVTANFDISHLNGGTLFYDIEANERGVNPFVVEEDFETGLGSFNLLSNSSSTFTAVQQTTNPADGNGALDLTGYTPGYAGVVSSFTPSQPLEVSYYFYTANTNYSAYITIGNSPATTYSNMFYAYTRYGQLRVQTWFGTNYFTITTDQWNLINLKNIDWTAHTFDLYLNGSLLQAGLSFADINIPSVNEIHLWNGSTPTCSFDKIRIRVEEPAPISMTPASGVLSSTNTNTISLSTSTANMVAGQYIYDLNIRTNGSGADSLFTVPWVVDVTGQAIVNLDKTCFTFGNTFQGLSYNDSVQIINSGCDSLHITNIVSTTADLSAALSQLSIEPWDTAYLQVVFNPTTIGTYTDSLKLTTNAGDTAICLSSQSSGAPQIETDSAVYNRYFVGCFDSVPFDFKIYNQGLSNLNWDIPTNSVAGTTDDFENGFNASFWSSIGSNLIFNTCDVNSGTQGLGFTGSNRFAITNSFNLSAGDSVRFWARPGFAGGVACENPDGSETLFFDYSSNGTTWINLGFVSSFTTVGMMYRYAVPVSGSIQFRFRQTNYTGSTIDNYIVDDFSIGNLSSGNFNPSNGSLASGDSVSVSGYFDISNLSTGIYQRTVLVKSNDPVDSIYSFTVNLNITGLPEINGPVNCLTIDSTMLGFSMTDSIMIFNSGCDDLNISNLSTNSAEFIPLTNAFILAAEDTAFIHVQFAPTGSVIGPRSDTLTISNNDSVIKVCLNSFALGAPLVALDTNAINVAINSCDDSVLVHRTIYNNGMGNLNFEINGNSSSSNPGLQEVLDTFKNGHSPLVGHIPNPYFFSNGINGNNIGDGGGDMYDGGNFISTDVLSNIAYSHDLITSSTGFGPNGQYFTYKGSGMWLLAADLDGINNFRITGNLGADGSGLVNASVLTYQKGSTSYKGFVKRVYSAGDPSINHLMIVKDDPAITRTNLTTTSVENHNLFGLTNATRIYYLLYAGASGSFINDVATQNIMDNFIDMVHATGGLEDWITVAPDSGQVAVNDSVELDIWIKSTGLTVGNHTASIVINTNDLANPTLTIPVNLTINGSPEMEIDTLTCLNYANVLQGVTESDTLWLYNSGCDTLDVTNITNTLSEFSVLNSLPIMAAPLDSVALIVEFTPITVGSFADTLRLLTNDGNVNICLSATSLGAALLSLPSDSLVVDVNKCRIIQTEQYPISNIGQGTMNYGLKIGEYQGTNREFYNTLAATTDHKFKNTPIAADTIEIKIIINGDYGFSSQRSTLYINGNYYSQVYNNNLTSQNDTIIFTIFGANAANYTQNDSIDVRLINTFNVDGIANSFHQIDLRVVKNTNWVAITGSTGGTIAPNGNANHNLLFNSAGLAVGKYRTILQIASNQPNEPFVHIPLVMNVISEEELVLSDTCVNFPNTFIGDTSFKRLVLYNIGCEPLSVSNIINTNNVFKLSANSGFVAVDDSLVIDMEFVPTIPGNYSASLIINNSDSNRIVCVNGTAIAKPDAGFTAFEDNVCLGKFIFQDTSVYTPTGWQWDFGDGNLSTAPNPTHFFSEPGFYEVKLTVVNLNGLDTMTQTIHSKALMADFTISTDTTYGDSIVSFGDSSRVGSSWMWDFGDGNSDTLKNPSHVYMQTGTFTVSYTVTNAFGCTETLTKTIVVLSNIGLNEAQSLDWMIDVYPNPSTGQFNLSIDRNAATWMNDVEVYISDMTGRKILMISGIEEFETTIDLKVYEAGVYMMNVYKKGELISHKRLVKNK